ncbi:unnamed protein product [Rangifer tarandus platyrhynchus]|uniref:Uncharacterized protein n=1 Tax=Rangifer tarandus platyrhynchus TaxID=3082113 RepID=A0AC60A9B3_RANTA
MTYFLGQGAKRALGREPVPPPVLPHPTCPPSPGPLSRSPSQASSRAPPFLHQGPHPPPEARSFILSPVSLVFLSLLNFSRIENRSLEARLHSASALVFCYLLQLSPVWTTEELSISAFPGFSSQSRLKQLDFKKPL